MAKVPKKHPVDYVDEILPQQFFINKSIIIYDKVNKTF